LLWLALIAPWVAVVIFLQLFGMLGAILATLFYPVALATFMIACRNVDQGQPLHPARLALQVMPSAVPLVTLGGMILVANIVIHGSVRILAGSKLADLARLDPADPEAGRQILEAALPFLVAQFALVLPLMMCCWFAPALVVFHAIPAVAAIRLSFLACLRNLGAFLVYGGATFLLMLVAGTPMSVMGSFVSLVPGLLGLLLVLPTLVVSIYVSYTEIFPSR
jgi:hypothetical protein